MRHAGRRSPEAFVAATVARHAANLARPQVPPTVEVEQVLGRPARMFPG
ncbi:hypothetical protein ACIA5G_02440 [Amycolatopsis sp. NPDC051758]